MTRDRSVALMVRSCSNKKLFTTKADAKRWLRLSRQRHFDCEGQRPYLCRWCGYFHLGHPHRHVGG